MNLVNQIIIDSYGLDFNKINPNLPLKDIQILAANQFVEKWIMRPENRKYLHRKKEIYASNKGYSCNKNLKNEFDIPYEAWALLPEDIKSSQKEIQKWVLKYHPYLMFSKL